MTDRSSAIASDIERHRRLVGQHFQLARNAAGLRASAFARRIGVSQSNLWNIETGHSYPNLLTVALAAIELGVTTDYLIRGDRSGLSAELALRLPCDTCAKT